MRTLNLNKGSKLILNDNLLYLDGCLQNYTCGWKNNEVFSFDFGEYINLLKGEFFIGCDYIKSKETFRFYVLFVEDSAKEDVEKYFPTFPKKQVVLIMKELMNKISLKEE